MTNTTKSHNATSLDAILETSRNAKSIDGVTKQRVMDEALETARKAMFRDTLETTNTGDDFFETSAPAIRDLIAAVFETAYHQGLHAGYRQGRTHACKEADGQYAPSSPNNPTINR